MPAALPWQKRPPSLFARILAWCNGRVRGIASFAHRRLRSAEAIVADAGSSGEAPDLPRHSYDVSLLFRRMAALQVDRDELASDDPLLFRELQANMHIVSQQGTLCVGSRAGVRRARESRLARILPQCHDAECSWRRAKLRAGGAIPAHSPFHRLLGRRVIGSRRANAMSRLSEPATRDACIKAVRCRQGVKPGSVPTLWPRSAPTPTHSRSP